MNIKQLLVQHIFFFIFRGGGVNKELNNFQSQKGETPGGDTSCFTHGAEPELCAVWNAMMFSETALLSSFSCQEERKSKLQENIHPWLKHEFKPLLYLNLF